ncbi:hypothetical protein PSAC2689_20186 [Paraburkholderia sacchari]
MNDTRRLREQAGGGKLLRNPSRRVPRMVRLPVSSTLPHAGVAGPLFLRRSHFDVSRGPRVWDRERMSMTSHAHISIATQVTLATDAHSHSYSELTWLTRGAFSHQGIRTLSCDVSGIAHGSWRVRFVSC